MAFNLEHHYCTVGDVQLHYVSAGQGPTIVFLHGWPQTWYMWRDILPGLAQNFRVIAVDLRGLGDSSRPISGYDTKTVSEDIWRLMHNILGLDKFFVAAHDWGGPIAYALAAQHRSAVQGMAIFDVPVPGDGTPIGAAARWHFGFHYEPDFPEALTQGREEVYLSHFYRKGGARPDAISPEAQREYIRAYSQPGAMRAGFNYYRALLQDVTDNQKFLAQGKLDMPILVYGGDAPGVGRGMSAMESWKRVATNVNGGVAHGCGHWIPEEKPAWVTSQLLHFFMSIKDSSSAKTAQMAPSSPSKLSIPTKPIEAKKMFFETIDTSLIDVESMPWIPFVPYTEEVKLKLIKVDPIRGEWITLLKAPPGVQLPKHHHSGTVIVYTIQGSWRYLEHDWVASAGSVVFETAGTQHTPVGVGTEDVITLNIVQGDWNLIGPDGQVLAIENWKTMMQRYLQCCEKMGITPIDVSSFSQ